LSVGFHDSSFDVLIVAAPRVTRWPSVGVQALSRICGQHDLKVGLLGGQGINPKGVIPLPTTGGVLISEDSQKRIHRLQARSVVKITSDLSLPDPFPGWRSEGVLPYSTTLRLLEEGRLTWNPATVILGSGNKALRLASRLLHSGISRDVYCVETHRRWGKKEYAGWEVEKRRFEVLGGRLIYGDPVSIKRKSALLWDFRVKDAIGVRVIEVARVVAVGPFFEFPGIRESPPGSFLFEFDQTSGEKLEDDIEGWRLEEERGQHLATRLVRDLSIEIESSIEDVSAMLRKTRVGLRFFDRHKKFPQSLEYRKKWLHPLDLKKIRDFEGVPQQRYKESMTAAIECLEPVSCNRCETVCPEKAIKINRNASPDRSFLFEDKCTGCGICVRECPSKAIVMIQEKTKNEFSRIVLSKSRTKNYVRPLVQMLNRRGEKLGAGRRVSFSDCVDRNITDELVEIEIPEHLIWEARGVASDDGSRFVDYDESYAFSPLYDIEKETVEVNIDGERRRIRDGIKLSVALFEIGHSRSEDVLLCADGSCGLCEASVDSVRQLGCQINVRQGMSIRTEMSVDRKSVDEEDADLCPCMGVSVSEIVDRIEKGALNTPEAVLSLTRVGHGKCHAQRCMAPLKRLLMKKGLDANSWIDWRFPWSDWKIY